MKKKKVIEYIWTLNDGGAETLVKDYALLLDKNKFEVIVLTNVINKETANYKILKENGITVISLYKKWNVFSKMVFSLLNDSYIKIRLSRFLRKEKPDCIHAHLAVLKYLVSVSEELNEVNLLYTCHSTPEKFFSAETNLKERNAAIKLVKNNGLRFIALHNDMKNELNRLFGVKNTSVIRNGINFERFINVQKNNEYQRELGIPPHAFVLGNIGRFEKVKNHDFIIDVFIELTSKQNNAFLLLVGDGSERKRIEERITSMGISDRVIILSNRTDIPELLKCMDCFILPSLYEGLGIAFIEAQISEIPCVVSDRIPNEAYISNAYQVLSLDKSSINDWVAAILKPTNNAKIVVNKNEYDMKNEIRKLEELYLNER